MCRESSRMIFEVPMCFISKITLIVPIKITQTLVNWKSRIRMLFDFFEVNSSQFEEFFGTSVMHYGIYIQISYEKLNANRLEMEAKKSIMHSM